MSFSFNFREQFAAQYVMIVPDFGDSNPSLGMMHLGGTTLVGRWTIFTDKIELV